MAKVIRNDVTSSDRHFQNFQKNFFAFLCFFGNFTSFGHYFSIFIFSQSDGHFEVTSRWPCHYKWPSLLKWRSLVKEWPSLLKMTSRWPGPVSSVLSEEFLDFQDPNICLCWCNFHLRTDWSAGKKASSKRWCWTYGLVRIRNKNDDD